MLANGVDIHVIDGCLANNVVTALEQWIFILTKNTNGWEANGCTRHSTSVYVQ